MLGFAKESKAIRLYNKREVLIYKSRQQLHWECGSDICLSHSDLAWDLKSQEFPRCILLWVYREMSTEGEIWMLRQEDREKNRRRVRAQQLHCKWEPSLLTCMTTQDHVLKTEVELNGTWRGLWCILPVETFLRNKSQRQPEKSWVQHSKLITNSTKY